MDFVSFSVISTLIGFVICVSLIAIAGHLSDIRDSLAGKDGSK